MALITLAAAQADDDETLALDIKLDRRRQVSDQIYTALKKAIISLRLPPRTSISENRICRHVGVSRTPVREAIIRLAEEDLIEVFPQQGSFVSPIKLAKIRESQFVRNTLEIAVLRRAADGWTPERGRESRRIIALQEAALVPDGDQDCRDVDEFFALDELFHRSLCVAAGMEGVWNTILGAKAKVDRLYRMVVYPGRLRAVVAEHAAVLDALDAGDAAEAAARLEDHLAHAAKLMDRLMVEHSKYFAD